MSSIQWILLVLCIAGIMFYFMGIQRPVEGYRGPVEPIMGSLPMATQASFIPTDSASASTARPQLAKPDYRDWIDAIESFNYFLEIYSPASATKAGVDADATTMSLKVPGYLCEIDTYIMNPESVPSRTLLDRAAEARVLADAMRQVGAAEPIGLTWL